MSDIKKTDLEIRELMDEFLSPSKKNKGIYQVHKNNKEAQVIKNRKSEIQVSHNNLPESGGTVLHGDNNVVHNYTMQQKKAVEHTAGKRNVVGYRTVGKSVAPENMDRDEFIHFLAYKFDFDFIKAWDGIERYPHKPNYEPEVSYNDVLTKEDALKFLGIYIEKSPDKTQKRTKTDRRVSKKSYKGKNKRKARRREADRKDAVSYFVCYGLSFYGLLLWGFLVVFFNYIKG